MSSAILSIKKITKSLNFRIIGFLLLCRSQIFPVSYLYFSLNKNDESSHHLSPFISSTDIFKSLLTNTPKNLTTFGAKDKGKENSSYPQGKHGL